MRQDNLFIVLHVRPLKKELQRARKARRPTEFSHKYSDFPRWFLVFIASSSRRATAWRTKRSLVRGD